MSNRLKEDLIEAGRIGRKDAARIEAYDQLGPLNGVTRPEGTPANKLLRDFTVTKMCDAGLKVTIDTVGNIFGRKEGAKIGLSAVMSGSHLDSVTDGGMFDGTLGVFTAIESIRRMNAECFSNERPIEIVAFTGEEGSAFSPTLLGSSVFIGKMGTEEALSRKNEAGQTLREALESNGYLGNVRKYPDDIDYYIETHIEQGPVLDREKLPVGIVENIVGVTWLTIMVRGQENHAGSTPMDMRKDALVAAAEIVSYVSKKGHDMAALQGTVATVGKLNVSPNGMNIIPGKVEMGIDIRDTTIQNMETMTDAVIAFARQVEAKYCVRIDIGTPAVHSPERLAEEVVRTIESSACQIGIPARKMNSGAVHDAQNMAQKVKAGMIFVPSIGGISHSPMEWTEWESVEAGAKLLTQTLKNLSKQKGFEGVNNG